MVQRTGGPKRPPVLLQRFTLLNFKTTTFGLLFAASAAFAQDSAQTKLARDVLSRAQSDSFQFNREFCGTIGVTDKGQLVASAPRKGRRDTCRPRDPVGASEVTASYHTHAGFDWDADSEVPSVEDVLADMSEGLDGYVATPGGRFWFIDGQTGVVHQICAPGCLPVDPEFEQGVWGNIKKRYTLDQLERRANEQF